jgi:hypothetical protein
VKNVVGRKLKKIECVVKLTTESFPLYSDFFHRFISGGVLPVDICKRKLIVVDNHHDGYD